MSLYLIGHNDTETKRNLKGSHQEECVQRGHSPWKSGNIIGKRSASREQE